MILIIDLTDPEITILRDEFVAPITRYFLSVGQQTRIIRLEEWGRVDPVVNGIIICGTALADDWYVNHSIEIQLNLWNAPILGICAGMQMLLTGTGGERQPFLEIGMTPVYLTEVGREHQLTKGKDDFSGYSLHQYTATRIHPWISLAESDGGELIVMHQHKPWFGVLFHPEVRNEWIFERFLLYVHRFSQTRSSGIEVDIDKTVI